MLIWATENNVILHDAPNISSQFNPQIMTVLVFNIVSSAKTEIKNIRKKTSEKGIFSHSMNVCLSKYSEKSLALNNIFIMYDFNLSPLSLCLFPLLICSRVNSNECFLHLVRWTVVRTTKHNVMFDSLKDEYPCQTNCGFLLLIFILRTNSFLINITISFTFSK